MFAKLPLEVKYGLLSGIFVSLVITIEYLLGFHTVRPEYGRYSSIITAIIPIIVLYKMLKRKREMTESYNYSQALKSGAITAFSSAIVLTLFFALYMKAINPKAIENALKAQKEAMTKAKVEESKVQEEIKKMREAYTLQNQMAGNLIGNTVSGMVLTVILGMIVRKKKVAKTEEVITG